MLIQYNSWSLYWELALMLIFKTLRMPMKQHYTLILGKAVRMFVVWLLICCFSLVLILACSRSWERRRYTCWLWGAVMIWRAAGASRVCGIKHRARISIREMNRDNQPYIWRSNGIGLHLWSSCLNVAQTLMRCGSPPTNKAARGYSPSVTGLCTLLAKLVQKRFWV